MDIDNGLVCSILDGGTEVFFKVQKEGIEEKHLFDSGKKVFRFISEYFRDYGDIPSKKVVKQKIGVTVENVKETAEFYIDEVRNRILFRLMKKGVRGVIDSLEAHKVQDASDKVISLGRDLWKDTPGMADTQTVFSLAQEVKEHYLKIKKGEIGIPSPWGGITEATLGWWPGDLIAFISRLGVGKSFTMILLARAAWEAGYRVLFVCTEMSRVKIAQRFFSIHLGIKYDDLRRAQLGEFEEQEFFEKLDNLSGEQGIDLVGDDFDVSIDSIEAAVYRLKPHLLLVDGMYLVKAKGIHDRHTRVSHVSDELKKMGKRYNMAVVVSSQFNRKTKKDDPETASDENIGISDVLAWDADVVWALVQTSDMRQDREMTFKAIKIREGELTDVVVKWDFEEMDFSEIVEGGSSKKEFDDSDFEDVVPF